MALGCQCGRGCNCGYSPPPPPLYPPPPTYPPTTFSASPRTGATAGSRGTLETGLFITVVLSLVLALVTVSLHRQRRRREHTVRDIHHSTTSDVVTPASLPPHSVQAWPPIPTPDLGGAPQSAPGSVIESGTVEQHRLAAIRSLPVHRHGGGGCDEECVLCIEAYTSGEVLKQLPCGHVFHAQCIDRWLVHGMAYQTRACPLCKADPCSNAFWRGVKMPQMDALLLQNGVPPPTTPRADSVSSPSTSATPTLSSRALRSLESVSSAGRSAGMAVAALTDRAWRSANSHGHSRARRTLVTPQPAAQQAEATSTVPDNGDLVSPRTGSEAQ